MTNDVETIEGCTCIRATAKACLIRTPEGVEVWVPKSVIHDGSEVYSDHPDGSIGRLVVARWFAEKEGLG